MTKFKQILIATASVALISTPAFAAPTINFSIVNGQITKPTMTFNYKPYVDNNKNGKYVWQQTSLGTAYSASANTNDNDLVWAGPLYVDSVKSDFQSENGTSFTGAVPTKVKSWSHSGNISFPTSFLGVYQQNFADYCDQHGKTGVVEKDGFSIFFYVRQGYTSAPGAKGQPVAVGSSKYAVKPVSMPIKVVCGPKPANQAPRPGGVVQKEPGFSVKSIALNYGGVPAMTKPNPATQCKQAKLTVTLHASKAGVVDFRLHKKIGNGPIQAKNVQAYAKFDGNAHFVASHQEIVSVEKTTMVQAMAEELVNPIGQTTGWKDVTLRCEDIGGGFAGTPKPGGSGTQSAAPAKPNAAFGTRPQTQAPFKPVIAPAVPKKPVETKTAPVRQNGANDRQPQGRIGQLLPAIQKVR